MQKIRFLFIVLGMLLSSVTSAAVQVGKAAAKVTDVYVHDNPWRSIGVAAAVGLVVGLLAGRR
jgi:ElaB/YqjD/DUF883 family membrane-anchored ribosome-binding protein